MENRIQQQFWVEAESKGEDDANGNVKYVFFVEFPFFRTNAD